MLSAPAYGATWFVDKDATGANNGTAWADAFTTIQPAIDATSAIDEIWVAEGVYGEARTSFGTDGSGLDTGSGVMKSGVALYGGVVGIRTGPRKDPKDSHRYVEEKES